MTAAALTVTDLAVRYGSALGVANVSFDLDTGQIIAVVGANGAGKSSLARAIAGLVSPSRGRVTLHGRDVTGASPHRIRSAGLVLFPEGRGLFPSLTVLDNLRMAVRPMTGRAAKRDAIARAFELFPTLEQRCQQVAGTLSGGEQQMLCLAAGLVVDPTVIVADELSFGLAPKIVDEVFAHLIAVRDLGVAVVLIEQFVHRALDLSDQVLVLRSGRPVWSGPSSESRRDLIEEYLGAGGTASGVA